ncbi:MAG: class I SAM-dependent methyltransferase [archaeon]
MYKNIAKSYNKLHKEEQLKKLKIIKENIKIIPPLLDIGCGTGISTNFFKIKSIGIDPCIEMIRQSKSNNLIKGYAENLPFKDKSFNTVISVTSFHNFKDMEKALKEALRVSSNKNIAISFLKKSKKLKKFKIILKKYSNFKEIEEDKDLIFILIP